MLKSSTGIHESCPVQFSSDSFMLVMPDSSQENDSTHLQDVYTLLLPKNKILLCNL